MRRDVPGDAARRQECGADFVKRMLSSSEGDLNDRLHNVANQIVTEEGINHTLRNHEVEAAYWVAAASLLVDRRAALEQLEHAVNLHPDSPQVLAALVEARIANALLDEATLAWIHELKRVDPSNALADYYAVHVQFSNGNTQAALKSLAEAAGKERFSDGKIEELVSRYDFLVEEGCSDTVALALSAYTLDLSHLGMIRNVGQAARTQIEILLEEGRGEEALRVAQDLASIGRGVAASGQFIVYDRLGTELVQFGFTAEATIYEAMGENTHADAVSSRSQVLAKRIAMIDEMVRSFGTASPSLDEDDIVAYIDSCLSDGEFSAMLTIPEVVAALRENLLTGN